MRIEFLTVPFWGMALPETWLLPAGPRISEHVMPRYGLVGRGTNTGVDLDVLVPDNSKTVILPSVRIWSPGPFVVFFGVGGRSTSVYDLAVPAKSRSVSSNRAHGQYEDRCDATISFRHERSSLRYRAWQQPAKLRVRCMSPRASKCADDDAWQEYPATSGRPGRAPFQQQ